MSGWFKTYYSMIEWEWYHDIPVFRLFSHLLLIANFEEKRWQGRVIGRGELITSLEHLAKGCGLSVQQTRTALAKLQKTGEINIKTTNKYTHITICNYAIYQDNTNTEQQTNNKRITNEQQTNNNNLRIEEYKNINNDVDNTRARENFSNAENSDLSAYADKLKSDTPRCEKECMENGIADIETLGTYIDKFNTELYLSGRAPRCFADYRSHFHNWLRVRVDIEKKELNNTKSNTYGTNKQNNRANNDRPDGWIDAAVAWGIATANEQRTGNN